MCPHKQAFVLSQGIIGDAAGIPKVACPLHKKTFSLEDGELIGEGDLSILTFSVKIVGDGVLVELPAEPELDAILGTSGLRVEKSDCVDLAGDAIVVPPRGAKSKGSFSQVLSAGSGLIADVLTTSSTSTALRARNGNETDSDA